MSILIETDICVTLPFIYLFFVETKKKSLEEIDVLFGGRALGTLPEDVAAKDVENDVTSEHKEKRDV